jgi:hypothetical protein
LDDVFEKLDEDRIANLLHRVVLKTMDRFLLQTRMKKDLRNTSTACQ